MSLQHQSQQCEDQQLSHTTRSKNKKEINFSQYDRNIGIVGR